MQGPLLVLGCNPRVHHVVSSVQVIYGGAAQDFVTKPAWETYGWAFFTTPAKPPGSEATKVNVQVRCCVQQLHSLCNGIAGNT